MASKKKSRMQWYRVDLHIHTPASADYQDSDANYIDILLKAEQLGVDIIAFTDHNTLNGYAAMLRDVEQLHYLKELGRAQPEELRLLAEYSRLSDKIMVLPAFEFTATFGFHILGIFPPQMSVRELEYILLSLNVPVHVLEEGNSEVGASSDVLTAYRTINEAGGICIAAHANTTHGVAMRGVDFGGQTRIAYTQDRHLHALEATDMGRKGRNTQRFFNGTKPEYPRRMRCIQGSDAHSINAILGSGKRAGVRYGVGERVTEVLLPEKSFPALLEMFQSNDFSRSRPYNPGHAPEDYVETARKMGPTVVQSFHETMSHKGGKLYNIIADVCAFANTNGGTVYIGVNADKRKQPAGVSDAQKAIATLQDEIASMLSPSLNVEIDTLETRGKTVIRVQVPYGEERPYSIDNTKIYVRGDDDTSMAIRDEIVELVRQGIIPHESKNVTGAPPPSEKSHPKVEADVIAIPDDTVEENDGKIRPPRAGVEIVGAENRGDTRYYIMRDLRNGNIVKNVTKSSARRLWDYAIKQREANPVREDKVDWKGDIGLWRTYRKSGAVRYDLVQRNGNVRVYYGVTEGGMHGVWQQFLPDDQTE